MTSRGQPIPVKGYIPKVNACPDCQKIMRENTKMTPLRLYHEVHKVEHMEELNPPHTYIKLVETDNPKLLNEVVHDPDCWCGEYPKIHHKRHRRYLAFGRDF